MSELVDVRDLLDPELRPVLDAFELPPIDHDGIAAIRGASFPAPELSDAVTRTDHLVPGDPPVRVRVHRPISHEGRLPAVVTIHGGGYVIGSYDMDDPLLDQWCPAFGIVGISVDYRLAPETPYPGPLDDCYAALRWTSDHADELGIDTECIGVSGLSVGAGLPQHSHCSRGTGARSRLPSNSSTAPCSTTARRPPPYGRAACTCGVQGPTSSAGAPTSASSTSPTRCRSTRRRPAPQGSGDCRRPA